MSDAKHAEFDDLSAKTATHRPTPLCTRAVVRDERIYDDAAKDPEAFWARLAGELDWSRPWTTVLDGSRRTRSGSSADN
jgi:hypothetical protein